MSEPVVVRTCVGCRGKDTKRALLRLVAGVGADGSRVVLPDPGARAAGRGAYLHPSTDCLERAVRRRAFTRALRVQGELSTAALTEHVLDWQDRPIDRP